MVTLLEARALVLDYPGPLRALAGVDFSLSEGQLVVVCGPNGSGKSTLLQVLGGLLSPTAGRVDLRGRPLRDFDLRERARCLARVPQVLRTLPDVSVEHFVLSGRYARIGRWRGPDGKDRDAVRSALDAADIGEWATRPMSEISGGQRQRALVARALAQEADVLLVDEPTNALDPAHQVQVFGLLARLVERGRAAVVVTHDLNLASQFATEIVLLDAGRVAAQGVPGDILRPEVLAPVYGEHLHFGRMPAPDGRPFVLPWLQPPS